MMPNLLPQYLYVQSTPQNNARIQDAPSIQDGDGTERETGNQDVLHQVMTLLHCVPCIMSNVPCIVSKMDQKI